MTTAAVSEPPPDQPADQPADQSADGAPDQTPDEQVPHEPDPTAAPAPTTDPGAPGGWVEGAAPAGTLDGCCLPMWTGTASPAFPDDPAAPIADGVYSARAAAGPDGTGGWARDRPHELSVELRRIERCAVLGPDVCAFAGPYSDSDVSTAPSPVRTATVRLDRHVAVVLAGYDLCASVVELGNGDDLAALLIALHDAYRAAVVDPLTAGATHDDVLAAIGATPHGGLEIADPACMTGVLRFRSGDAPPLLLRTLTGSATDGSARPLAPTEVVRLVAVDHRAGHTTLVLHAGFVP